MTSLFRPILPSLLCLVVAWGHAPAWLHVATCDGHGHHHAAASVCSHGCHHHAGDDSKTSDGESHHQHDADDCPICQSLASPSGVNWNLDPSLLSDRLVQSSDPILDAVAVAATLSIARPRGPPVCG
ncbi:DUF2946 domain-containing protein [Rosistilla oblonga]|uniref:DUF2946 domain-containing protein n=1 Tax=Rosistilla oblonga TaxID=2527990 RepID=UPI0011A2FD18|nr:DUF2946 domain-containing protein [Rosistilla oblonga]